MNTQFKKGVIELCVLSVIAQKDMYGYELVQEIDKYIPVNENTIYPILRRLTKEGNFSTYKRESTEGPPRKYYQITNQGLGRYKDMKANWDEFIGDVANLLNREDTDNE